MQNRRPLSKISGLVLTVLLVASCGKADNSSEAKQTPADPKANIKCLGELEPLQGTEPSLPITLNSVTGESVTVTSIDRVVTIAPGSAEIAWALGLGNMVAGKDLVSVYPGSDQIPTVNPGHEVAIETVLILDPTLVLADKSEENSDAVAKLNDLGIPVVAIPEATSVAEIAPRVSAIANSLGVPDAGKELVSLTETKLQQLAATTDTEKTIAFLYLRGNAGVYLIGGKGSGADSIITALGAKDAGTQLGIEGFAPLTAESLAKANPDILLVMNEGLESVGGLEKLLALPGVSSTKAAKNAAVIQADDRILLAFGPQTPNVISCLAEQLASFEESV
jgi:iron complex transport system substrate-binding protein